MTEEAFQKIFYRLQTAEASREEMELFLAALEKQDALKRCFQDLLKAHFETEQLQNTAGQQAGIEHKALDQLLNRSWALIEAETLSAEQEQASEMPPVINDRPLKRRSSAIKWMAAAAALLIIALGAGLLFTASRQNTADQTTAVPLPAKAGSAIVPGKSAAILTLSNGRQVQLDSTADQNIQNADGLIAYNKAGKINYHGGASSARTTAYNTLTTQKGNRYQLVLPDGTKAWLNAESSIRFPDKFPADQRNVAITGEVYFEVLHDEKRPFTVQVKGQTIRDIGTAFNINAYENEPDIKTTLIEGIIEVNDIRLKPGWQAAIDPGGKMIIDKQADLAEITSWKENMFLFHQTDMDAILRQIARWYDVEIIYKGKSRQTFTGGISRQTSLEEILKILSFSNKIKFEVHGRNIIVQSN